MPSTSILNKGLTKSFTILLLLISIAFNSFAQAPVISYQTPQTYLVNSTISTLSPTNTGGVVPVGAYGQVTTYSGNGIGNVVGSAASAKYQFATGVATDNNGIVYVADYQNNSIKKIAIDGSVSLFAGNANSTAGTADGIGPAASFAFPISLVLDNTGNVYVVDFSSSLIRKITPAGVVTTLAGNGAGFANGNGTSAKFSGPTGIAIDGSGNLYVADRGNNLIRKITPTGDVSTYAGTGATGLNNGQANTATFKSPEDLTFDNLGNLYVTEFNNVIRKITPTGDVTTFAGNGLAGSANGSAATSSFKIPAGITADRFGYIYVGDSGNFLIRKIAPDGQVSTLAGNGSNTFVNGVGTTAGFSTVNALTTDNNGNIYVADSFGNSVIRKIQATGYTIDKPLPAGLSLDPSTGVISGTPTAASLATNYTVTAYNKNGSNSTVISIAVNTPPPPVVITPPVISYQTPKTYLINNLITALTPTNTGGAVPATVYGQVSTYAGSLNISFFFVTTGVALDAVGNMYVCSWGTNEIIRVSPTGVRTVIAGGRQGSNNGQGTSAQFYEPDAIIIDAAGNLIVADQGNNLIRKITPGGLVTTLAGSGVAGAINGTGTTASFNSPRGLAIDAAGNIYVADQASNLIRKISPAGVVTTYAGTGGSGSVNGPAATASFSSPCGVGLDAGGNLYVGDSGNNSIRKITPTGVVSTVATGFNFPREVKADGTGNLYVCDQQNHVIKRISPTGIVTTIAGTGQQGANNGNGNVATFNSPIGLTIDGNGNLFVGDSGNSLVRKVLISGYTIDRALPAGLTFDPTTGIISGTPTVASAAANYTITAYNGGGSNSTVVSIEVISTPKPSVITFILPAHPTIDANNNIIPGATSTNNETPIIYTSSDPTVAYITTDGLIHVIAPGVTTITATQAGSINFTPATPVSATLIVMQNQILVFPAIATKKVCDADFPANVVSSNSIIPITYSSSNSLVATVDAQGLIHITGVGTSTIIANQAGSNLYNPAPTQSQVLTVNAPIVPLVTITPNATSVCTGSSVTYIATISNVTTTLTYQWQVNGVNVGNNSSSFTYIPTASSDVVKCSVTNTASCNAVGSASTSVTVNPYIITQVSITSPTTTPVCIGTAITFTAAATAPAPGQVSYKWQVNGVDAGSISSTFTSANLADGDLVTCMALYSDYACYTPTSAISNAIQTKIITPATPSPSVTIASSANNVYTGTSVTFTATPLNADNVTSYQWKLNGINVGTNSPNYSYDKLKDGSTITCTIISSLPCTAPTTSSILTMTILPLPDVKIPNTFTPNGDGTNDTWNIANLIYYPNCAISIYDRNGKSVFHSRQYPTAWDGTYRGQPLPVSTYYYVIDLGNNGIRMSGSVTIVR